MNNRVLVVEDDEALAGTMQRFLSKSGYQAELAQDGAAASALLSGKAYDLIIADINLASGQTGLDLLREVRERKVTAPVIITTGYPTVASAAEAVRLGAFDYLCKPVEKELLLHVARTAVRHHALNAEKERYRRNLEAVYRSVQDAIITLNSDAVITGANWAAEKICGISPADAGKASDSQMADHCGECLEAAKKAVTENKIVNSYKFECRRSGMSRVLSLNAAPLLDDKGIVSGAVLVIRDETRLDSLERDLKKRTHYHKSIIGKSEPMQELYALLESLAGVQSTVMITGETGTGKERAAEALHYTGARKDGPLVKVNCSSLSEGLLESELFGHVKGAFTGAVQDKLGRFEAADKGTLLLDEIGDVSPAVQKRLLRVLQEKQFERVGDTTPVRVDVRILAATNKDLNELVRRGEFREDLFYRLKVIELKLPALRERKTDLPLLTDFFLEEFNREFGKNIEGVSSDVVRAFMDYHWPGNVRELRHALEHACILCKQALITLAELPRELREARPAGLPAELTTDEASFLLQTLKDAKWNKTEVARVLGVSRQTLYRKLKALGIEE